MIEAEPNAVIPERARIITHLNRIENDIERTYPELKIFKKDNEQGQSLFNILTAWAVFRDDVGYIQGMSQIAGLLLI